MAEPSATSQTPTQPSAEQTQTQAQGQEQQQQQQQQQQGSGNAQAEKTNAPPAEGQSNAQGAANEKTGTNAADEVSRVTPEQWLSMTDVVIAIYDHREPDGYDPSRLFHRSVNKRYVPDYYEVIKEPMALSILKAKIKNKQYQNFSQFVRDCALIPHNAQAYNRPKSQAYEDALVIKEVFAAEFRKLAEQGIITPEEAELPDLGEIPEPDPLPEEEEEEEEEDEDEDDDEDTDDDGRRKKRGRGRGKRSSTAKGTDDPDRKRRGRPPRVDTPMEARIKSVLKTLRKFKDPEGNLKVLPFERLPDRSTYPDYYAAIREPMAIDMIKRKCRRRKYTSVDHFLRDIDVMFNNAKAYNAPDSAIYQHADELQREAHRLAEQEKKKSDNDYLMEDGRLPLPNGILYKGELWKVGDWVHIQNPNDPNKPIVGQIYRTWQDLEGRQWMNACWYYRPEQTVHRFDKHFYPFEVMKTGQYRDHRIEEIIDRCFVMFFTRYNRGRPRGFPPDKQIYVCEARYNEEKHKLNKIKTWASCLPDEVREQDYELDLFDQPQKIRKVPSPIRHLLREDAKPTDNLPKPTWGADNAPPIVGAVHCRPRDKDDSPPPSPSPPPAHIPPGPAATNIMRQQSMTRPPTRQSMDSQGDINMARTPMLNYAPSPAHTPAHMSATPAAPMTAPRMPQAVPPQAAQVPAYAATYANRPGAYMQHPAQPMYTQPPAQAAPYAPQPYQPYPMSRMQSTATVPPVPFNPNAPRSVEVYTLPDETNNMISKDVRDQFQCDEHGRILFFTAPPLDPVASTSRELCHSAAYLAAREKRKSALQQRRKEQAEAMEKEREDAMEGAAKRRKLNDDVLASAYGAFSKHLQTANEQLLKAGHAALTEDQRDKIVNLTSKSEEIEADGTVVPYVDTVDAIKPAYFLADSHNVRKLDIQKPAGAKRPARPTLGRFGVKSW